jgi:hypothetical protein
MSAGTIKQLELTDTVMEISQKVNYQPQQYFIGNNNESTEPKESAMLGHQGQLRGDLGQHVSVQAIPVVIVTNVEGATAVTTQSNPNSECSNRQELDNVERRTNDDNSNSNEIQIQDSGIDNDTSGRNQTMDNSNSTGDRHRDYASTLTGDDRRRFHHPVQPRASRGNSSSDSRGN